MAIGQWIFASQQTVEQPRASVTVDVQVFGFR
jgi:hypothetical protein